MIGPEKPAVLKQKRLSPLFLLLLERSPKVLFIVLLHTKTQQRKCSYTESHLKVAMKEGSTQQESGHSMQKYSSYSQEGLKVWSFWSAVLETIYESSTISLCHRSRQANATFTMVKISWEPKNTCNQGSIHPLQNQKFKQNSTSIQ